MLIGNHQWDHIMIHHSATVDSETYSWAAIRKYHMNDPEHMWTDIGYHFGVEIVGADFEALVGRPLDMKGAHCPQGGMNERAIGICIVGNFDIVEPNPAALKVLSTRLLRPLMRIYNIPPAHIVFHREFNPAKTCPGKLFSVNLLQEYIPKVEV